MPAPTQVELGPYVRYTTPSEAVVSWWTRDETSSILDYGSAEPGDGANEIRTHDLLHAMQALSQLSYGPGSSSRRRSLAAGSGR